MGEDKKDLIKVILIVTIIFAIFIFSACNGGWSIAGVEISPADSISTDFIVIQDQDSIRHWYVKSTVGGILSGDNYCHRHHEWEDVRKKSEWPK